MPTRERLKDRGRHVAIAAADVVKLPDRRRKRRHQRGIERAGERAVAVDARPAVGVEVCGHRYDCRRLRDLRGHQPGEGSASAIADQDHAAKRMKRQETPQRGDHAGDDFGRVTLVRPKERRTDGVGLFFRREVARPAQEEARAGILRHQLEGKGCARCGIGRGAREIEPGRAVMFDVDVQRVGALERSGRVRHMMKPRARQVDRCESQRVGTTIEAFRRGGARSQQRRDQDNAASAQLEGAGARNNSLPGDATRAARINPTGTARPRRVVQR